MAVDPNVAARCVAPVAGDPAGAGVGSGDVSAGDPDITGTVPAMVAWLPNPAWVRRNGNNLADRRGRRTDVDIDLGAGSRRRGGQDEAGNKGKCGFLHGSASPAEGVASVTGD